MDLPAGHHIEPHMHGNHQLLYMSSGASEVRTAAGSWIAPPDRVIWIPAGCPHEHRFHGPTLFHSLGFDTNLIPGRTTPLVLAVTPLARELIIACSTADLPDPTQLPGPPPSGMVQSSRAGSRPGSAHPVGAQHPRGAAAQLDRTGLPRSGGASGPATPGAQGLSQDPAGLPGLGAQFGSACPPGSVNRTDSAPFGSSEQPGLERPSDPATSASGPSARLIGPELARLRQVLLDQLRRCPEQPLRLPVAVDSRLRDACELVQADLTVAWTLAVLGRRVGVAERTLTRLFRAEFAMTYPQWRTQLRLYHATRLLAEGESVTSVAHRCGWATPSAFIDVYRQMLGHTPGSYRATVARASLGGPTL